MSGTQPPMQAEFSEVGAKAMNITHGDYIHSGVHLKLDNCSATLEFDAITKIHDELEQLPLEMAAKDAVTLVMNDAQPQKKGVMDDANMTNECVTEFDAIT